MNPQLQNARLNAARMALIDLLQEQDKSKRTHNLTVGSYINTEEWAKAALAAADAITTPHTEDMAELDEAIAVYAHVEVCVDSDKDMKVLLKAAKAYRNSTHQQLNPDMAADELRLHMGELTPDEVLVARAAIRWANSTRLTQTAKPDGESTPGQRTLYVPDITCKQCGQMLGFHRCTAPTPQGR